MIGYQENIPLDLSPATMWRLEPVIRQLGEDEWESDDVQHELILLANNLAARLQKIAVGDLQLPV